LRVREKLHDVVCLYFDKKLKQFCSFFNLGKICVTEWLLFSCLFWKHERRNQFIYGNQPNNEQRQAHSNKFGKAQWPRNCFPSREGTWQHHRFQSLDSLTYSRLEKWGILERSSLKIYSDRGVLSTISIGFKVKNIETFLWKL